MDKPQENPSSSQTFMEGYKCHRCGEKFETMSQIISHVKRFHKPAKGWLF